MDKIRKKAEALIYQVFDKADKSKLNSEFYKKKFAKMNDAQFKKYISQDFPFVFMEALYKVNPSLKDVEEALDVLGVPLCEPIVEPYLYKNEKGEGVATRTAFVGYVPIKKTKQISSKKNSMSIETSKRDMRSGLLLDRDKNGNMSAREFECLSIVGMNHTMEEFARPRADGMDVKSEMYNDIMTKGTVSLKDLHNNFTDSMAKKYADIYFLGAGLKTSLMSTTYETPFTIKEKHAVKVNRI